MSKFESAIDHERTSLVNKIVNRLQNYEFQWSKLGETLENKTTPEIALEAMEKLSDKIGYFPTELESKYLEKIEEYYADSIHNCSQDPVCIEEKLQVITLRITNAGIVGGHINDIKNRIGSQAYNPEAA